MEAGAHEGRREADEHEGRRKVDEHEGRRKAEKQEGRRDSEPEDSTEHEHKTDWQVGQDSFVRFHIVPLYKYLCNFCKSEDFHTTINMERSIFMKNGRDKELARARGENEAGATAAPQPKSRRSRKENVFLPEGQWHTVSRGMAIIYPCLERHVFNLASTRDFDLKGS